MKNIVKSKTFWLAMLQAIAGLVLVVTGNPELGTEALNTVPLDEAGIILMIKSFIDIYLRYKTSTPVTF